HHLHCHYWVPSGMEHTTSPHGLDLSGGACCCRCVHPGPQPLFFAAGLSSSPLVCSYLCAVLLQRDPIHHLGPGVTWCRFAPGAVGPGDVEERPCLLARCSAEPIFDGISATCLLHVYSLGHYLGFFVLVSKTQPGVSSLYFPGSSNILDYLSWIYHSARARAALHGLRRASSCPAGPLGIPLFPGRPGFA